MSNKLNVVFIGQYPFPVGSAMTKRHRYYIDYLCQQKNVTISLFSSWKIYDQFSNPQYGIYRDCVEYETTLLPKKITSIPTIIRNGIRFLKRKKQTSGQNIVIFCSTLSMEQFLLFLYAKSIGYKIIFDVVENFFVKGSDKSLVLNITTKITRLFYRYSNGFITISTLLEKMYQPYKVPTLHLTNSAPITNNITKKRLSTPIKILYVGTFAPKDGISYLIEGFDMYCRKGGKDAELILVGKANIPQTVDSIVKRNTKIKCMGFVDDKELYSLLHGADLLCMTRCNSDFANYGFPFKLSEYLATGNTVLATDVGDVSLYLKDKYNALLIPPESSSAICEAIEWLSTHEEESVTIGLRGLETIKKYFDVESNGKKLYDFLINI